MHHSVLAQGRLQERVVSPFNNSELLVPDGTDGPDSVAERRVDRGLVRSGGRTLSAVATAL